MSSVMNMMIIWQAHHLSTEKEGENLQTVSKNTSIITNKAYPAITGEFKIM